MNLADYEDLVGRTGGDEFFLIAHNLWVALDLNPLIHRFEYLMK